LIKLAAEDLVIVQPNRGAVVAPLNAVDFPKLVEALDLSQRAVTRLAAQRRSNKQLSRVRDAQDQVDQAIADGRTLDIVVANRDFHVAVADACNNRYLAEQYERQLNIAMRFSRMPFGSEVTTAGKMTLSSHLERVSKDHIDIVAAIANQDADRAEALAHAHTVLFRSRMLEFLAQSDTEAIGVEVL
jgi:DNA-binding GntR family transcriptional regulator